MRKIIFTVFAIILLLSPVIFASEDYTKIEGEDFFNETVTQLTNGQFSITPESVFEYIFDLLFHELSKSRSLIISIFVIALLSGTLNVINTDKTKVSAAAYFSCFALMSIAVIKLISLSVGYGTQVIDEMSNFVTKLAPILTILLVTSGYAASASTFYPVFTSSIYLICLIIQKCIVPMI